MDYFLGIDQGGTKTAALVCDIKGNILGTGYDNGLAEIYFNDTEELYIKRIVNASKIACAVAGIKLNEIKAVCGGLNGADWDHEYPILRARLLKSLEIEDIIVLNDCIAAMRGGSAEKKCSVICAGSGLNAAVRRAEGDEIIYGYYIADPYQGAGALGKAALWKAVDAYLEISGPTILQEQILDHTGYANVEELMIDYTTGKYELELKSLCPMLLKAALEGDAEALCVTNDFARGTARYIIGGLKHMGMSGDSLPLVFSGGVFKGEAGITLADKIFNIIAKKEPNLIKLHAQYEPVCGAALTLLDREYKGVRNDDLNAAFDESAKIHGLLRQG